MTGRELLDLATRRLDEDRALDDATRAELVDLVATIYAYLDETESARALAARGTAALAVRLRPGDPKLLDARFFEIWLALQDGDDADAERRLAGMDDALRGLALDRSRHRAEWHLASADLATDEEARKFQLERAIALYEQSTPNDPGHAAALSNLGELVLHRGEAAAALSLFERARRVALARGETAGTDLARIDSRRGEALLALSRDGEARAAFEEARRRYAGTVGLTHPTAWIAAAGLAAILERAGETALAEALDREIGSSDGWNEPANRERRAAAERLRRDVLR
jgi:hypothetical protein